MATFTITITNPYGDMDEATALRKIAQWNELLPTGSVLPTGSTADIKASAQTVLEEWVTNRWEREVDRTIEIKQKEADLDQLWHDATPAERAASIVALGG